MVVRSVKGFRLETRVNIPAGRCAWLVSSAGKYPEPGEILHYFTFTFAFISMANSFEGLKAGI